MIAVRSRMTGSWASRVATASGAAPTTAGPYRRSPVLLAAAGVLLAVAGCESSTAGHGVAASSQPAGGPGAGQQSGTATAAPPATPTGAPPAADGTDTSACADARCEVSVRGGAALPVPASTKVRNLNVAAVTGDRVTLTGRDIGDSSSGLCTGQCDSSSTNGVFTIKLGSGSRATENGLSITVERITDGAAVLKLEPAG
jgi:hypothetical protein